MEDVGKIVISLAGKRLGYILDIAVDEHLNKTGFIVVDEETENELFLSLDNVVGAQGDFVVVKSDAQLEMAFGRTSIIGKSVATQTGTTLGQIAQIVFAKRKCSKVITDKCEIAAKHILSVGEDVVFVGKKRKSITPHTFPKFDSNAKVSIQSVKTTVPQKVTLSSSFYLGKICLCDIFGYNNEKIIGKNEIVTKSVLQKAKIHNKINQLFFALKK